MTSAQGAESAVQQANKPGICIVLMIAVSLALLAAGLIIAGGGPMTHKGIGLCGSGIILLLSTYYGWRSTRTSLQVAYASQGSSNKDRAISNKVVLFKKAQLLLFAIGLLAFIGAFFL